MLSRIAGATLVAAALSTAPVGQASAHDHDAAIGLGLLGAAAVVGTAAAIANGPVYAAPPPVYYAAPQPVYAAPPVVYAPPYGYGYGYGYVYAHPYHYWHGGWGHYRHR